LRLTWIRGWGRGGWAALVMAGILLAGVPAQAEPKSVQGYCDANGKPVVTYGPPGWEERETVYCDHGVFTRAAKDLFPEPKENFVMIPPDDFAAWIHISLNRKTVRNPYNDVFPYVTKSSSRTLVPLRYLSEAFGANVDWNNDKHEAAVNWRGRTITVPIRKDTALVDGREVRLDQPALLWKDRTMVPLRFLMEAVGATVEWDAVNEFVHITLDGAQCAPNYCSQ
jgi:hypothetical protein